MKTDEGTGAQTITYVHMHRHCSGAMCQIMKQIVILYQIKYPIITIMSTG